MDICGKCWRKLCTNDKFYTQDRNTYIEAEPVLEAGEI